MKRILGALFVILAVVILPFTDTSAQSTHNFNISSYDIQYELSRDSESRSVLKATEMITAQFPTYNQNHGIERAIPTSNDGHSTHLKVLEVKDASGKDWNYSINESDGVAVLRIGDADSYVHGEHVFRIVYSQHDVTKYYADTKKDEWYWDTNGTEWRVPIERLTVSVKIDESLRSSLQGEAVCYIGQSGSTDRCTIQESAGTYSISEQNLSRGENVTVALGFAPQTFATFQYSFFDIFVMVWTVLQIISIPIALLFIVIFSVLYSRRRNRASEQNPIVAEYIPPKDASVLVASQVALVSPTVFSAQLIDLAVRRFISIVETKPKAVFKVAEYDIVILTDVSALFAEEKEILSDMFGHVPQVGERLALKTLKNNMAYGGRTLDNDKKLKVLLESIYRIREKSPEASRLFYSWAIALLIVGVLTLSFGYGIAALFIWIYGLTIRPLTDKGLALRRYVLGLDKYIKASETERLKFLQGPDTAQKVGYDVDPNNPGQLVKLYERVLPYAILFGHEKKWATQIGDYYQQSNTSPDWYSGTTAFNAVLFASTLSSFSTASTYSSGSSSSSGGSSGGGSSGGGGGGGGGGGW
jgi:uncharacterized membrane protein YgcG